MQEPLLKDAPLNLRKGGGGGGKWGERGGGGPILNGFESVSGTLEAFRINICNSVIIMLSVIRWKWVRARAVLKKQREKSCPLVI